MNKNRASCFKIRLMNGITFFVSRSNWVIRSVITCVIVAGQWDLMGYLKPSDLPDVGSGIDSHQSFHTATYRVALTISTLIR